MATLFTGGCLCGAVRYENRADESVPYLCHCLDCQQFSGGPFHSAIAVTADALTIHGAPKVFTRKGDSGTTAANYFCGDCGGHLFSSPWPDATRYSMKSGTLDYTTVFTPKMEIWTKRRVGWLDVSVSTQQFEEGPDGPATIGAKTD